jgi:hypothetical protein
VLPEANQGSCASLSIVENEKVTYCIDVFTRAYKEIKDINSLYSHFVIGVIC